MRDAPNRPGRRLQALFAALLVFFALHGSRAAAESRLLLHGALLGSFSTEDFRSVKADPDYTGKPPASQGELSPGEAQVRRILQQATALIYRREFDQAGKALRRAEDLVPDSPEVLSVKAALLAEQGKAAQARPLYLKLAARNPKAFEPRFNLAELLFMEKKYAAARQGFEALLADFPRSGLIRFKIFLTYAAEKNPGGMQSSLDRLAESGPSPFLFHARAAWAICTADFAGGEAWLAASDRQFGPQPILRASLADLDLIPRDTDPASQRQ